MSGRGEPWSVDRGRKGTVRNQDGRIVINDNNLQIEDARLLVTCVNAMAGIEDPAAFVASHAELLGALDALSTYFCTEIRGDLANQVNGAITKAEQVTS